MHSTVKIWSEFLELKWWQKILVFIPVILLIILALLFGRWIKPETQNTNEQLLEQNKKLVDSSLRTWEETKKTEEKKRAESKDKRQKIEQQIEEERNKNEEIIKKIDNAHSLSDLSDIAEELRRRNKERSTIRNPRGLGVGNRGSKEDKTYTGLKPGASVRKDSTTKW